MIVPINGKIHAFRFKHVPAGEVVHQEIGLTVKTKTPRTTLCQAVEGANSNDDAIILGTGSAALSSGDNYCKNTGRKIALARCLRNLKLNKDQRTQIWEAYFTMRGF